MKLKDYMFDESEEAKTERLIRKSFKSIMNNYTYLDNNDLEKLISTLSEIIDSLLNEDATQVDTDLKFIIL